MNIAVFFALNAGDEQGQASTDTLKLKRGG